MSEENHDAVKLLAPPPLIYLAFLVAGLIVNSFYPLGLPSSVTLGVGSAVTGVAMTIGASALQAMRRAGTSPLPSKPPRRLVVDGVFRFSRNPIYASLTLMYVGITIIINSVWPLAFLAGALYVMDQRVISREEEYLEKRFGKEYLAYKARVRRWV